jgi:hypothetical protein
MSKPESQPLICFLYVLMLVLAFSTPSLAKISKAEEKELMDKAYQLAQEGKVDESAAILEDAASKGSRIAVYNLAMLFEESGNLEKAVEYYRKYLEDPLPSDTVAEIKKIKKHANKLAAKPAEVTIETDPQGATVTGPTGDVLGETPLSIELGPGEHELTVRLDGFVSETKTIVGGCAKKILVEVKLVSESAVPTPGKPVVEVSSNVAKADVVIDGKKMCETPCTTELEPGEHGIEVMKKGFTDFSMSVELAPGEKRFVEASLEKVPKRARGKDPGWGHSRPVYLWLCAGFTHTTLGSDAAKVPASGTYGLGLGYSFFLGERAVFDLGVDFQVNPVDLYRSGSKQALFLDMFARTGLRIRIWGGLSLGFHVGVGAIVMIGADESSIVFDELPPGTRQTTDGFGGFLLHTSVRFVYDLPFGLFFFLDPFVLHYSPRFEENLNDEVKNVLRYQLSGGLGFRF